MKKELAILEIKSRIHAVKDTLGLKKFRRNPTRPFEVSDCPSIALHEGNDDIIKRNSRNPLGYPFNRIAEITIELVTSKEDENDDPVDIKTLYRSIRSAVFTDSHPLPDENAVFMVESRLEGPLGYGLPGVLSMRLTVELMYDDIGS